MKTIFAKHSIEDLYSSGYKGAVFVPVDEDMNTMQDGIVAVTLSWHKKTIRTIQQNKSIYKYCDIVAKIFNDAGITKRMFFTKRKYESSWTKESIIEDIWRELQYALFKHRNTSKLSTSEVSEVYQEMSRLLSVRFSVDQPFPNNRSRG